MDTVESPAGQPLAPPRYKQTRLWTRARNSWVGESVRSTRRFPHEWMAWMSLKRFEGTSVQKLNEAIALFEDTASSSDQDKEDTEFPVFLLSTGWRAGSTLLQRILVTDANLLLWGEPLGEMTPVSRLTEMLGHSISKNNLIEWKNQPSISAANLSYSWIANLYPPGESFRSALRAIFDHWLAQPARSHGFARWGLKEVRMGASDAVLLRWLYPNAKFLVISRHPYQCYRSLADAGWDRIYYRYPDLPVDSAASFGAHWNRIAVSWAELPKDFPVRSIRYEDMLAGKTDFRELETWLGITINEKSALSKPVGGTATRTTLSWYERLIIAREAELGMRAMGYSKSGRAE